MVEILFNRLDELQVSLLEVVRHQIAISRHFGGSERRRTKHETIKQKAILRIFNYDTEEDEFNGFC